MNTRYRVLLVALLSLPVPALPQSLGNAGTLTGTVTDASGAAIAGANVEARQALTGYSKSVKTDGTGRFKLSNIPPNQYHVEVTADGFAAGVRDIAVRSSVPIDVPFKLSIAGSTTTITVDAGDLIENVPFAHNDVDRSVISKLPTLSPGSGLSDAIMLTGPGVVADSNGFFHPQGDHAQTSFVIDGQPISDQQSKAFSTQIPANVIQSLELISGMPNAEFGDKTALVVNAVTRSGLGQKPFGEISATAGSFGTYSEEAALGFGGSKWGNFLAFNANRSGRFLDTPEFLPFHARGNNGTFFDRVDFIPEGRDAFHLNLFAARNWFQIPNSYDQPEQDQRQRVISYNVAPGYQHTFNANSLLTVNPFFRKDQVSFYASRDISADAPATLSQSRALLNWGIRSDVAVTQGRHNMKAGFQLMQTRLREGFALGITDPDFVEASGAAGLAPYDLTNGGSYFRFNDRGNINQFAAYVQDSITLGHFVLNLGVRFDEYRGRSQDRAGEPRIGGSYLVKRTNTVLRASYSRTLETPYNENLLLSSAAGIGGLAGGVFGAEAAEPLRPGHRNQYNVGVQQTFGRYMQFDADYFWKFTDNAYDFDVLLNTPVTFPISWKKSKIDGVGVRISTTNLKGFQAYTTMGHTRARFFGPENGGLIFNSPVDASVFRIDHDQAFQQTTNARYQHGKHGPWASFTWRYDSGLVSGAVAGLDAALALTGAQQAAIGFFCGGQHATAGAPITACSQTFGAERIHIPAEGTANDDTNPPRIASRHIFDFGIGTDNLLRKENHRTTLRFTVLNLTNQVALYNFLSTFSGTHFVTPRTYNVTVGFVF